MKLIIYHYRYFQLICCLILILPDLS